MAFWDERFDAEGWGQMSPGDRLEYATGRLALVELRIANPGFVKSVLATASHMSHGAPDEADATISGLINSAFEVHRACGLVRPDDYLRTIASTIIGLAPAAAEQAFQGYQESIADTVSGYH